MLTRYTLIAVGWAAVVSPREPFTPAGRVQAADPAARVAASPLDPAAGRGFVIDHRHVEWFAFIPPDKLAAAGALRMLFSDRSVGQNVNESLDCLTAASWPQSPALCRRDYVDEWNWKTFSLADWENKRVPARILFDPDPVTYNRTHWTFEYRAGDWSELTRDFVTSLAPQYLPDKDVLSYQFSYLNVDEGSDIADPQRGFFADQPERYDVHDLEALISAHPDKVFVFWTASLARGIGSSVATQFNARLRAYCAQRGHVLFDFADIESHTPEGRPCFDNRDGIPYEAMNGRYENYPDDGHDYPAICQDYTTEVDGGHLGSVSAARIEIAKGLWVLMARLAGWEPMFGDFDGDERITLADHLRLHECLSGPGQPYAGACAAGDWDLDRDVDLADVAEFARQFTGQ